MSSSFPSDRSRSTSTGDVVGDEKRLRALRRYDILDTAPEPAFDRVARLAARLFDAPAALVTFVDRNRQWFKSTVGIDETEMGLHASMCAYTLEKGDVLAIEDLTEDERFGDNPFVTDHGFRFYAGAPLVTPDGRRLGTVCVFDTEPRSGPEDMEECLSDLAAMVVDELERRRERAAHEETRAELTGNREVLEQTQQLAAVGGSTYDPQTEEVTWTDETYRIFGLSPDADIDLDSALEFYAPESRAVLRAEVERLLDEGGEYDVELDAATAQGEYRRIRSIGKAWRENGETTKILGVAQDITQQHRDRRLQEMQSDFFEWIATGAPIDAVIDEIVRFTEEKLPDAAVSILRLDDNRLYHVSGPSLPEDYIAAIDGVEIGPDVGACGAAAYREQEVVTEDIREDERWDDFRAAAEQAGFRSCASQTIQGSDGTVLGTFAVYREEPGPPIPADRELVERMSHVASVALERDRRVRALRASEERWRTLVGEHPGPIHVTVDGTFAYANEALAELFGVETPEAVVGKDVLSFARPDERARIRERVRRLAENREATPLIEHKIVRADGEERTVLVQSVPITYRGQEAAQTMMWDVTERRTAERELRQSEQKFRTIVENAQPITFMVDRDGTFVLSEGQDLQALDLEPGEVVGESIHDVEENNPEVIDAIQRALDGEYVDSVIEVNDLIFDCWYSPVHDDEGAVTGVIGMAADITERKARERELRDTNRRLRLALEAADAGTFEYRIAAGQVQMDERTIDLFGLTSGSRSEEASRFKEIILEDDFERMMAVFDRVAEAEESRYAVSYRVRRPDNGRVRHIHSQGLVLRDEDGAPERAIGISRDVTEQRRRKETLERQNDLFTKAQDIASVGAWEYDLRSEEAILSDEVYRIHGIAPDAEMTPERGIQFYHPDDRPTVREAFTQAVEEGEAYDLELRFITDDGAQRWVRTRGEPQRDDGEIVRVRGVIQDITERKEREKALRQQKSLLEQTQKLAGGWEIDLQAEEMSWSEEVYRIHEVEPGTEVSVEDGIEFYAPEARPRLRDAIQACINEAVPYDLELPIITEKGNRRWVRTVGAPTKTEDGDVVEVAGAFQDITERKEAEQHLRRSREQLSMAVEGGNIGTWNWDMETDTVVFNDRWAEMLGYAREELDFHFRTWEELVHPEDLSRALDELEVYIDGEDDTYAPEIRMRTKSGTWRWIQTIGKVVERGEDGVVTRVAGIHLDIDDRKRAEQALRDVKTRYQTLIEHFPGGGVFLFDENLEYTIAGGKGLEDVGLTPSDFEGSTIDDLFPAELAETTMHYYRKALEGEKNVFEQTFDGRHYRVHTLPLRDGTGDVVAGMAVSQNVTDRKETRQRLERYRAYTDRLLNAVDDLFFAVDEEGQLRRWNDRVSDVTGYSDDELETMTVFPLVPESEHERVAAKIADAFGTGSAKVEVPLLRKDGATIPYEFIGSVVEHPEDDLHLVGIGRDIAERKQRERLLEQAEMFFQNAQDSLFIIDVQWNGDEPTFVAQRVNPAYEAETGVSSEDIRGARLQEILGDDAGQHGRAMYRRCVDRCEPLEYEEEVPLDGTTTYWTTCIAPVVVDGTVQRIVGTTRNVTEQRRRKEALERQNDLFTKAQDIASVGAWEYDVQSDELIMTDEAYRIGGRSPGDGMTREEGVSFYHPEDQPVVREAIARAVEEGEPYDLELRFITDDGAQRWVRTRGEPQEKNGEVVRLRGTVQDVTERVRRREALKEAKDAAEEADRIKSALLSNMNHEFRTPLTSIISFSELLSREPELVETFADRILGGGRRLLHTLNTVMDFAELEAGSVSLTPMRVDVNSLVQSTVNAFSHLIDQDLSVQIHEPSGPLVARLDEHHVERVLTHLVHNAIKFTEEGTIEVTLRETADGVEVSVADPGIGIDPEVLPHMFDEFAQASSGSDRTHEGNGIGLTIVKRLVDQMDGDVTLHSTPGEGTEVTVRLPNLD